MSASDIAEIEEPLKDQVTTPQDDNSAKEESNEDVQSPSVTIEQAEADLASITREEENDDAGETESETQIIPAKEPVIEEKVDDVKVDESSAVEPNEPDVVETVEPEVAVKVSQEEITEEVVEEKQDVVDQTEKLDDVKEPPAAEPKVEQEDVESVSEQTKAESEEEDDTQERESVTSRPPVEIDDITTGTENTSDSYVEKILQEEDTKESEASEEEKKEEEPLPVPKVEPEVVKPKVAEKPPAKTVSIMLSNIAFCNWALQARPICYKLVTNSAIQMGKPIRLILSTLHQPGWSCWPS